MESASRTWTTADESCGSLQVNSPNPDAATNKEQTLLQHDFRRERNIYLQVEQ